MAPRCVLILFNANMIFKIAHIIVLASVKFFLTLPYAMIIGLEYEEAIFAVLAGGIGGFLIFFYLSKPVYKAWDKTWPQLANYLSRFFSKPHKPPAKQEKLRKRVKRFSRKNRFLVRFKRTYGFWGIIISTPLFLTIPLGAFLAGKYYAKRRFLVLYMILSIIGWAAVLSGIVHLFPGVFLK